MLGQQNNVVGLFVVLLTFSGLLLATGSAGAVSDPTAGRLTRSALTATFVGKIFRGVYQDGTGWREAYLVDGEVDYEDDFRVARGDWFVRDDLLCTFYNSNLTGGCFVVMQRSANCFEFYAVNPDTGAPVASQRSVEAGYDWTAQGGRTDRVSTCPEGLLS